MSSLTDLFEQVNTALKTGNERLQTAVGGVEKARNGARPRLAWVPLKFRAGGPSEVGGDRRALWSLTWTVELTVWADDFATADQLLEQAIGELHAIAPGAYQLVDGNSPTDELGRSQDSTYELRCRLDVEVLLREPETELATIDTVTVTPKDSDE
jgi:hypothetical protein